MPAQKIDASSPLDDKMVMAMRARVEREMYYLVLPSIRKGSGQIQRRVSVAVGLYVYVSAVPKGLGPVGAVGFRTR